MPNPPRDHRGLTPVQAAFVDAFTGCAAETARLIGASETYCRAFMHNPEFAHVRQHIRDRVRQERDRDMGAIVASRLERLAFWSDMMRNPEAPEKDRLRASELLGKAHMDFVEKTVIETTPVQVSVVRGLDDRIKQIKNRADWLE